MAELLIADPLQMKPGPFGEDSFVKAPVFGVYICK